MHKRAAYDESRHYETDSNLVWVGPSEDSGVKLSSTYSATIAAMSCRYSAEMGIQEMHLGAILLSSTSTP